MANTAKMFRLALNMASKSIGRRKFRAALTIIGIIIGISTIVSLMSVGYGMQVQVGSTLNAMLGAGITISSGGMSATIPEYISDYVLQVPGVKDCVPVITTMMQIGGRETLVIGIDPDQATSLYHVTLSEGRLPRRGEDNSAVISLAIADRLGVHANDTISLGSAMGGVGRAFTIVGVLQSIGSSGISIGCFISLQAAQKLLNKDGYVSMLLVVLNDPDQASYVEQAIKQLFPEASVSSQEAILGQINQILNIINGVLLALGAISLAVGAIGVMNTITMSVHERTREIGMMKAVGGERRHILLIFLSEAAIIGLVGGCLGIISGLLMVYVIKYFASTIGLPFNIPLIISPQIIAVAMIISLAISVLAGLYPSWKAANIRPVEALRYE
jgi:putative ABC transport system permease protein